MTQVANDPSKFLQFLNLCMEEVHNVNMGIPHFPALRGYSVTLTTNASTELTMSFCNDEGEKFSENTVIFQDNKFILGGANNKDPMIVDTVSEARMNMNRFKAEFE